MPWDLQTSPPEHKTNEMKITALNTYKGSSFCAKKPMPEKESENPISKGFEQLDLIKSSFIAGLGIGARALLYLAEHTTAAEKLIDKGCKFVDKNKKSAKGLEKSLLYLGSCAAMIFGFIGVIAALYSAYNMPKSLYEGKVKAFKKEKDMDLYIKGNRVEKELYNQMNEQAKAATKEEKAVLSQQYLKLKAAKNSVPEFVNMTQPK